jgi:butyrate kinase
MNYRILVINLGSTSTKAAVFENEQLIWESKIEHSIKELTSFPSIVSQKEYRQELILSALKNGNIELNSLSAIAARGGLLKPLISGTYRINQSMVDALINTKRGEHASNLCAIIAFDLGNQQGIPSYIVDPVSVDELEDVSYQESANGFHTTNKSNKNSNHNCK